MAAWAISLAAAGLPAAARSTVSAATCEADFEAMLAAIDANRESAIREIERQLAEAAADKHPALKDLREAAWMQEEAERVQASHFRRDCLKAAAAK